MSKESEDTFRWGWLRAALALTIVLHGASLYQFAQPIVESGKIFHSTRWQLAVMLGIFVLLLEAAVLVATWFDLRVKIIAGLVHLGNLLRRLKWLSISLLVLVIISYPLLIYGRFSYYFTSPIPRISLLWSVVLIGSLLLAVLCDKANQKGTIKWAEYFSAALVFTALAYFLATYSTEISAYPFALHWSETSRYYYASLFVSERVYGLSVPPTVLHPSRYLMQAVPFLIPDSTLWMHRAWQVVLWIFATFLSSFTLASRLSIRDPLRRWMFISWTFLFLVIGPVYYHLQVSIIIVILGFNRQCIRSPKLRNILSISALILASAWAGISRINWFPVPGMLATSLVLLQETVPFDSEKENPLSSWESISQIWINRPTFSHVIKLFLLVIFGTIIAFSSQALYIAISGNKSTEFTSSFTSDLFWYRLFPSSTYPPGILPAILVITLPFLLLTAIKLSESMGGRSTWKSFHPVRWLGLGVNLLVLFLGGLLVSIKIGGGSNLHNLDAYMVMLLVITSFILFNRTVPDVKPLHFEEVASGDDFIGDGEETHELNPRRWRHFLYSLALATAFLIPVSLALTSSGVRVAFPEQATIDRNLQKIRELVEIARQKDGEVLLITERQLLTFGYIEGVPLVPEYEKVFLMEMAMARNQDYLSRFQDEIRNKRFALIISEPLFTKTKGKTERFGEENNVWVDEIVRYLECYYQSERTLPSANIQLLVPSTADHICP